jgi:hypothetical protein
MANPPVRGTGDPCKERSLGWSSKRHLEPGKQSSLVAHQDKANTITAMHQVPKNSKFKGLSL